MCNKTAFIRSYLTQPYLLTPITGGLSHSNYRLELTDLATKKQAKPLFVRSYGDQYQLFGNQPVYEQSAQRLAARAGIAPGLLFADEQGMITEWIDGKHWDRSAQKQSGNIIKLAETVAKLHQLDPPEYQLKLDERLQHYYCQLESCYQTEKLQDWLKQSLSIIVGLQPIRAGFCHHDINPLNVMVKGSGELCLLDWEFGALGDCDFDIAVIFNTFAWSPAQQQLFLEEYQQSYVGVPPQPDRIKQMAVIVEMMTLLWCIIMYQTSAEQVYLDLWQQSAGNLENLFSN